uniref:Ig-like domain-containing protein n=1 Tax=Actinotalea sp. TaxID=1872145 RepID=UPI00356AD26A
GLVLTAAADGTTGAFLLEETGLVQVEEGSLSGTGVLDQVTAVGGTLVAMSGTTVRTPSVDVDLAGYGADLVLQQVGPADAAVLVATTTGLLSVDLGSGAVSEERSGGSGVPAAPVRLDGCGYAAWAAPTSNYLQSCPAGSTVEDLDAVTSGDTLVFRVNRDVLVLNSVSEGRVWSPTEDSGAREPNWDDVTPRDESQGGDALAEQPSVQTLQSECTAQSGPPKANDDDYGVRSGRTTILSVVDNDVSSDCGILAITELESLPSSFGTAVSIYGGRAIQLVTTPDASGTASFTYTVTDGRGSSAPSTATVTLTVRADGENNAPVQRYVGELDVELGAYGTYDVLADFLDPDGDQLVLMGASLEAGGTVRTRQDGELTFQSDGATLGRQTVRLSVSDGRETIEGTLVLDVRAVGSLVPLIDPVHAVTYVGEPVVVQPLESVRSASQEPIRLAGVDDLAGTTITTDLVGGTFTFTAARAGPYYVTFVVTASPKQATGIARIDVVEKPEEPQAPTAVLDVALLPPGGEVTVDPLANDVDPNGGVLVLQSVDIPEGSGVEVAILAHRFARITSTRVLTESVSVRYTISNGLLSATGELRVKPIEATAGQQPPVVPDVTATVRTGGVVTIAVLENAYDPDGDPLTLERELVEPLGAGQGLMFVSGDVLRYQAPSTPMTVHATFEVTDSFGQSTAASVTVSVHASDATSKSPPRPVDLTARVFEGEVIRIPVPLTGIDADGDGVLLLGQDRAPTKGRITQGADWFEYEALPGEFGTDTFTYAVEDWVGQRAVATIRVGISPRPNASAQIVARNDDVVVRPGRTVSVRVLANDVDMSGGDLELSDVLEVADGVSASVDGRRVVVDAPETPGVIQIGYTATNTRGGSDSAILTVTVDPAATIRPPVARDVIVPATQTLNAVSVDVDVLEVAENPSGPMSDLTVSVDPSAAEFATVTSSGTVVVTLGPTARTFPYLLTNTSPEANGAFSYAFITVPALGDFPPTLRPGAKALVALAGVPLEISLDEEIQVAPGRSVRIADVSRVTATKSDGSELVVDQRTLRYTADRNYAGPASISVPVSDGDPGDATARTAVLTLPITVVAAEDHPPTFSPSVLDVGPGESVKVDLRAFTSALVSTPSGEQGYTYALTTDAPTGFSVQLDGSVLTVSAAATVPRGTAGGVGLTIDYGGRTKVVGQVDFRVVASSRPLARVVDRTIPDAVEGVVSTVDVLEDAFNPYPATALSVVGASVDPATAGTVTVSGGRLSIRPATGFIGTMIVRYQVRDVTADPDREVSGQVTVVVRGRPSTPTAPRISEVRDKTVVLAWDAPSANGTPITGYRVTASPGGGVTECASTTCTVTGLTNDVEYTFTVVARNAVGDSDPSPASGPARPDTRPGAPATPGLTWGNGAVTATWTAPVSTGSPVSGYQLEISPAPASGAAAVTTTSTSFTFTGLANGTEYRVRVRAENAAPDPGDWSPWSAGQVPAAAPDAPGSVLASRTAVGSGVYQIDVGWSAPAANGDPVTTYEVRVDGVSASVSGSSTSYVFPAERGREYTVDVRALNKAGSSPWSSTTGEIWSAPGAVTALVLVDSASAGAAWATGELSASWKAPADTGGVPLTGYRVSVDGGPAVTVTGTSTVFSSLTGGQHSVSVVAVNSKGEVGPASTASGTTLTVPQAPSLQPAVVAANGVITFSWLPGGTGGSVILDY